VTTEEIEQCVDTFEVMRRQLDSAANGVNQPAEDSLERRPAHISFEYFLDGGWLLSSARIGGVEGSKDVVEGT
jgi:hypothetical protein